jgi:hypothetical protein
VVAETPKLLCPFEHKLDLPDSRYFQQIPADEAFWPVLSMDMHFISAYQFRSDYGFDSVNMKQGLQGGWPAPQIQVHS